ncbi:MAG: hypothetical protein R3E97_11525 [Candidatus Eisenbacteria bacterium]
MSDAISVAPGERAHSSPPWASAFAPLAGGHEDTPGLARIGLLVRLDGAITGRVESAIEALDGGLDRVAGVAGPERDAELGPGLSVGGFDGTDLHSLEAPLDIGDATRMRLAPHTRK